LRSALTSQPPPPGSIAGLRNAEVGIAAPLGPSLMPKPQFGRAAFIGFWEDDDAIERFIAEHPLASHFAGGFHVRLDPLRAFGSWPGLPADVPATRSVEHDGPVGVITLGRLRASQAPRFFRATAKAEGAVVDAPGLTWATGIARVPKIVSTFSLWESTKVAATYAYGNRQPAHSDAIAESEAKPFHHQQAFIRFRRTPRRDTSTGGTRSPLGLAGLSRLGPGARASTRPAWPVSFMPVSVRSCAACAATSLA
jgi:hypothetical protein